MKTIFYKLRITLILITFTLNNFAQVDISINAEYLNNQISNCNDIDLNLNNAHYIYLNIHMEKFYDQNNYNNVNDIATSGIIHIKLDPLDKLTIPIESSDWNTNSSLTKDIVNRTVLITIYNEELDDNWNNDILYATYENGSVSYGDTYSCPFTITRPHYYLSPSSTTIPCSSTYSKYFSVSNSNDSPGNVIYQWSVGSGWLHNGISESNFDTTSSNISLTPTSYPPSDVHVTPVLDGVSYDELTSNVSLSDFNTNNLIIGNNSICNTSTFHLQNSLPSSWSVNWSLESTNIASITQNGNNAIITANPNQSGIIRITATIENSCGQQKTFTKSVKIGNPIFSNQTLRGLSVIPANSLGYYSAPISPNATSYHWTIQPLLGHPHQIQTYLWQIESGQNTRSIRVISGSYPVIIKCHAINSCGSSYLFKSISIGNGNGTLPIALKKSNRNTYKIENINLTQKNISSVQLFNAIGIEETGLSIQGDEVKLNNVQPNSIKVIRIVVDDKVIIKRIITD